MIRRLCFLGVVALLPSLAPAADFDAASAANQLGLDLYRQLAAKDADGNLALSPYSITSALALAYAGADGATRTEMATVLHFPADDASVQASFGKLRTGLDDTARRSVKLAEERRRYGGRVDPIEWRVANRLFGQRGYAFRDSFLTLMKDGYAAPFASLDFKADSEAARVTINGWVAEQTREKIRDLIPPNRVDAGTRLVLVNALYLKAPWQEPFKKFATLPQPFHRRDGTSRDVPTMQRTASLGYAAEDGLTVVALEYLGGDLQFLILLPDAEVPLEAAAAKLTPQNFARWAQLDWSTHPTRVWLYLPKFRLEGTTFPLGSAFRTLGMRSAFDEPAGSANFDRIAPRQPDDYLAISEVFHQTFISLDEAGTEAAAATAVAMAVRAALPPKPIEVRVDRPFLFAIQHRPSGTCLFLGRVTDPR